MSAQAHEPLLCWPGNTVLAGSTLALALVVYGALRFPASVANGGVTSFLIAVGGLAAYGTAALWARALSPDTQMALRVGGVTGVVLGAVAVINHAIELWTSLSPAVGAVLGAGMWGLMFLGFGIACSVTLSQERPFVVGLLSSASCAMVMAIVLIVFALSVGFAFMPHMQSVLSAPYAASGMTQPSAFVARHLISTASSHLFIAPAIAVFVGILSAAAFYLLAPLKRGFAIAVACIALLLLIGGAAAIKHASSLARSRRPPFIDFGLGSLAVALVSAHPLILALQGQSGKRRSGV